eukprot:gene10092-1822_t
MEDDIIEAPVFRPSMASNFPSHGALARHPRGPCTLTSFTSSWLAVVGFRDFETYCSKLHEDPRVQLAGVCKVVPPREWHAELMDSLGEPVDQGGGPPDHYVGLDLDQVIPVPIRQDVEGSNGMFQVANMARPRTTVRKFRKAAAGMAPVNTRSLDDLSKRERLFWRTLASEAGTGSLYGAGPVQIPAP